MDRAGAVRAVPLADPAAVPLAPVEEAARAAVPFSARATRIELWRQDAAGRWHPHWVLPLGVRP
jgi:hypothetical protein